MQQAQHSPEALAPPRIQYQGGSGRATGIVLPPDPAVALRRAMQRAVDDDAALARRRDNTRPAIAGNTRCYCVRAVRAVAWAP